MSKPKRSKKRGRPVLRDGKSDYKLSVRLTELECEILRNYCWRYDLAPSDVVRDSLSVLGIIPDFYYHHES